MEATMGGERSPRPVGFMAAVTEQMRLLWMTRRPLLLLAGLLAVLVLSGEPWSDHPMARLFTMWPLWLFVFPPLWAFAVWHGEGPSNRLYFWSHPVSRAGQSLARVLAGAIWLVLLYALLVGAGAFFGAIDSDLGQFGGPGFAAWLSFFTGPLILYLVISVLTLPSDYPIRWFLALLWGIPLLISLVDEWLPVEPLLRPLTAAWGFAPAVAGPFALAMERLDHTLDGTRGGPAMERMVDLGAWSVAMPFWLLLVGGIVVALAHVHPDRRPSLRRKG